MSQYFPIEPFNGNFRLFLIDESPFFIDHYHKIKGVKNNHLRVWSPFDKRIEEESIAEEEQVGEDLCDYLRMDFMIV